MSLLGRLQWMYRIFPSVPPPIDPRMEEFAERLVRSRMPGRYMFINFVSEEQAAAELRYAVKHPIPIPRQGLVSKVRNYFLGTSKQLFFK